MLGRQTDPLSQTIQGSNGADSIAGAQQDDLIVGRAGDDTLRGAQGDDTLVGGPGDDILVGGGSEARGDDDLDGGDGADSLFGANGEDTLYGGAGDDLLNGGDARDTAVLERFPDTTAHGAVVDLNLTGPQDAGNGLDTFVSIENLVGTRFDDLLTGNFADNRLIGFDGRDTLVGNDGDDYLQADKDDYDGGSGRDFFRVTLFERDAAARRTPFEVAGGGGIDVLSINNQSSGGTLKIDLSVIGPQRTGLGLLTLTGVEVVSSGENEDRLTGDARDNTFYGGDSNDIISGKDGDDIIFGDLQLDVSGNPRETFSGWDTLMGGAGDDTIVGGLGADIITGGGGHDVIRYLRALDSNGDQPHDTFATDVLVRLTADDVIDLSALDANDYVDDGNQAFRIVSSFTGADGELRITYEAATDRTYFVTDLHVGHEIGDDEFFQVIAEGDVTGYVQLVL